MIVKVGGSVFKRAKEVIEEIKSTGKDCLIIPGGWVFADIVRLMDLDDDTAHWMALKAMDVYGLYLSSFAETLEADDFNFKLEGMKVLLPYSLVRKYDELPHSWEATSDSVAVWVAGKLGIRKVVKVTDVDGIFVNGKLAEKLNYDEVPEKSCIDSLAVKLAEKFGVEIFVCNGFVRGRVKNYILRGSAVGTLIGRW
ncbi:aspartate/glutamate/uridylate kinase [Ferroglobus placidus DSM 10642]|uniref:Aspartate/glutamate/uridylate kinase n=1 Tax=Ferroglobus placidus (strain DSM 10642 / AEDII12DO) TaxID=589924 RepID=D3RWX3_FERPA|nr:uridylate kinase [Ferroglobus placidus]ADC64986.1 aspartate/glutamate/uridylate kinase [Ferroglobus placidus DSM 10642]